MTAKPYLELRADLANRDKSLKEKVLSLDEAAKLIHDGETLGVGGSTLSRTPMAMIWALIRAKKKNLTACRSIVSSEGDLLLGSGICNSITTSWFSQGIVWGVSKVMRRFAEAQGKAYQEWSHLAMGLRFRAGAMGISFLPMRSMIGSDLIRMRPEVKEMRCPFTQEPLLLVPALNPDVAIIHVQRCDAYGNAHIDGLSFMDIDLAMAAKRVILTTERIVSNNQIRRTPDQTKIPFFSVEAVVEVPYGAAPHECGGLYEPFFKHMDYYTSLVNADPENGLNKYLEEFIYEPKNWNDFLNRIGLDQILEAAQGGRSIFND
jgi:glutaconate CoA-transferase subunit A